MSSRASIARIFRVIVASSCLIGFSGYPHLYADEGQIVSVESTVNNKKIDIKVGVGADTPEIVRWKVIEARGKGASRTELRQKVREQLQMNNKLPYGFQRVEVTGWGSTDDTDEKQPGMFDKQIKMSYYNDPKTSDRSWLSREVLQPARDFLFDSVGAISSTRGAPTDRSRRILAPLKDAKINEIFADSWGSEAIYAGILAGDIPPPQKLFITDVPEENKAKWRALAKYTGIEVHVVGFQSDKVRMANNSIDRTMGLVHGGLPRDPEKLDALWARRCEERNGTGCADPSSFDEKKFDYDVDIIPPGRENIPGLLINQFHRDHDRMLGYIHLFNRGLFNKTIEQLDAPRMALIKSEEGKLLAEALAEARVLVADAKKTERQYYIEQRIQRAKQAVMNARIRKAAALAEKEAKKAERQRLKEEADRPVKADAALKAKEKASADEEAAALARQTQEQEALANIQRKADALAARKLEEARKRREAEKRAEEDRKFLEERRIAKEQEEKQMAAVAEMQREFEESKQKELENERFYREQMQRLQASVRTGGDSQCSRSWAADMALPALAQALCHGSVIDESQLGSSGSRAVSCILDPGRYTDSVIESSVARESGCVADLMRDLYRWMRMPSSQRPTPESIRERVRSLRESNAPGVPSQNPEAPSIPIESGGKPDLGPCGDAGSFCGGNRPTIRLH